MTTTEENELLCEKLLGWTRLPTFEGAWELRWNDGTVQGQQWPLTPTFTDWASAGLILEALQAEYLRTLSEVAYITVSTLGRLLTNGRLSPAAVRACALEYLEATKPDLWTCDECAGPPRTYEQCQCIMGNCKPVRAQP